MKERRCVGIDVSADEIVVAISGKAERLEFANDLEGHARLVKLLTRGKSRARICLEATGSITSISRSRFIARRESR